MFIIIIIIIKLIIIISCFIIGSLDAKRVGALPGGPGALAKGAAPGDKQRKETHKYNNVVCV